MTSLLNDLVCMVYHEGRNVRFPIRAGLLDIELELRYKPLTSLPADREDAWRQMHSLRIKAANATFSPGLAYSKKFGVTPGQLADLFDRPIWKHSARGGNKWGAIARKIQDALDAHAAGDFGRRDSLIGEVVEMRHNTGTVVQKLQRLRASSGDTGAASEDESSPSDHVP